MIECNVHLELNPDEGRSLPDILADLQLYGMRDIELLDPPFGNILLGRIEDDKFQGLRAIEGVVKIYRDQTVREKEQFIQNHIGGDDNVNG